jgi:hypothetical protein
MAMNRFKHEMFSVTIHNSRKPSVHMLFQDRIKAVMMLNSKLTLGYNDEHLLCAWIQAETVHSNIEDIDKINIVQLVTWYDAEGQQRSFYVAGLAMLAHELGRLEGLDGIYDVEVSRVEYYYNF